MSGPLAGVRIVEFVGQGPGPWAAMVLSDMGAEVLRVDRADQVGRPETGPMGGGGDGFARDPQFVVLRNRRSVALDLKSAAGAEVAMRLIEGADALIEGFRPGVMERLGLGPAECLERNGRLVYGRVTGWGQDGPWSRVAGHDINVLALSGMLSAIGPADGPPAPPLALVGDYGGGGAMLAFGLLCGLFEARGSGRGQVVDHAMFDGVAQLGALVYSWVQSGNWKERRAANMLDGGAPFYATYETSDRRWIAVGTIEPKFFRRMIELLGIAPDEFPDQYDEACWAELRDRLAGAFRARTRDEWVEIFLPHDACFAPVLTPSEALAGDHAVGRGTFVEHDGVMQPAPAPRLSRTPGGFTRPAALAGRHTDEVLGELGLGEDEVDRLHASAAAVQADGDR